MAFKHLCVVSVATVLTLSAALAQQPPDPPAGVVRLFPEWDSFPTCLTESSSSDSSRFRSSSK